MSQTTKTRTSCSLNASSFSPSSCRGWAHPEDRRSLGQPWPCQKRPCRFWYGPSALRSPLGAWGLGLPAVGEGRPPLRLKSWSGPANHEREQRGVCMRRWWRAASSGSLLCGTCGERRPAMWRLAESWVGLFGMVARALPRCSAGRPSRPGPPPSTRRRLGAPAAALASQAIVGAVLGWCRRGWQVAGPDLRPRLGTATFGNLADSGARSAKWGTTLATSGTISGEIRRCAASNLRKSNCVPGPDRDVVP